MKPYSDVQLLVVRITVEEKESINHSKTEKEIRKQSQEIKTKVNPIIREELKRIEGIKRLERTIIIESTQGCTITTLALPFIIGIGANIATPYIEKIGGIIKEKIKKLLGNETEVEANIISVNDMLNHKNTTIIINGEARIICIKKENE